MELEQWSSFDGESDKTIVLTLVDMIVKKWDEGINGTYLLI